MLEGEITVKLGDDVLTLGRWDAVLIPSATPRAVRNDTDEEAAFALCSVLVTDQAAESVGHEGFWP